MDSASLHLLIMAKLLFFDLAFSSKAVATIYRIIQHIDVILQSGLFSEYSVSIKKRHYQYVG